MAPIVPYCTIGVGARGLAAATVLGRYLVLKRLAQTVGSLLLLATVQLVSAQIKVGNDLEMTSSGTATVGYNGAYGDEVQSTHGLQFGFGGDLSGSYYNPNFLNFNITPYYNNSHANSESASITASSGVNAIVNLFTGSHFPGSVNYSYSYNSSQSIGLPFVPAFTSVGTGQGFGIGWSALFPDWPTLSVAYSQGSGSGNLYGTTETTQSNTHTFDVRSSYNWEGFNLNASYIHQRQHSNYPLFLGGQEANSDSHGNTFGFGASHELPWNGQMFVNYTRNWFAYNNQENQSTGNSSYTTNNETAGASFHPIPKLTLTANESYTDNLSGYLSQYLGSNGVLPPPVNFGSSSNSFTVGGGAGYAITNYLYGTANATYYDQHYFGQTYTGTYLSGSLSTWRRLWDTFSFSASVIDSASQAGQNGATASSANGDYHNSVGFTGTVNANRWLGRWELNGNFGYTQNAQWQLITYTVSNYNYGANVHRRFHDNRAQFAAAFVGTHSGLTQEPGTSSYGESYSTSLSYRWIGVNGNYGSNTGVALLTPNGIVPLPPLPGEINPNTVLFSGHSYGGGLTLTPVRRLSFSANYTRAISNTLANTITSRNNMELAYAQLQYRFRRITFLGNYTRLTQGISASGSAPGTVTSYYVGISRWFDFF